MSRFFLDTLYGTKSGDRAENLLVREGVTSQVEIHQVRRASPVEGVEQVVQRYLRVGKVEMCDGIGCGEKLNQILLENGEK